MTTPQFPTYSHQKKTKGGGFTKPLPTDPRKRNSSTGAVTGAGATVDWSPTGDGMSIDGNITSNSTTVGTVEISSGIITSTSGIITYYGDGSQLTGIIAGATLSAGSGSQRVVLTSQTSGTMTTAATDAELTYDSSTDTLIATNFSGNIVGTAATFTNVFIDGILTYEDVTNVDSIGIITARNGIVITGGGGIDITGGTGIITATSFVKAGGTSSQFLKADGSIDSNTYVTSAGFESGTVMLFYQAAAPTGWTQVTDQDNKALRVVSGTGGGTGGSTNFTSVFSSRTVPLPDHSHPGTTDNANASHGHNTNVSVGGGNNNTGNADAPHGHNSNANIGNQNSNHTHNTPNGGNHPHPYERRVANESVNLDGGNVRARAGNNLESVNTPSSGGHSHTTDGVSSDHSHPISVGVGNNNAPHSHSVNVSVGVNNNDAAHTHTFTSGFATIRSGSSSPVATSTATMDFAVQYIDVIICSKD